MKRWGLFFVTVLIAVNCFSQVRFQKTYMLYGDGGGAAFLCKDSLGYFFEISTIDPTISYYDVCLAKVNLQGDTLWTKYYGGGGTKGFSKLHEENNGNITMIGSSYVFGSGSLDNYIVKINPLGDTLWTKAIGNSLYNATTSSIRLNDGSFVILSFTDSSGIGSNDSGLIKIDSTGNMLWNKYYEGGVGFNTGAMSDLMLMSDGGFIMCGSTFTYGAGDYDTYLIRTDSLGNFLWAKTFGGNLGEGGNSLIKCSDGIIIASGTKSFGQGGADIMLLKLDFNGNIIWAKTYGTNIDEYASRIKQTSDNGFVIVGGGPHVTTSGNRESFLMKIDSLGNFLWAKKYGASSCHEDISSINITIDGGFVLSGNTCSYSGASFNYRTYIVKTDSNGNSGCNEQNISLITQDITSLLIVGSHTPNVYTDSTLVANPTQTIVRNDGDNLISNTLCYSVVGVEEIEANANNIKIYPTPSSNQLNIEYEHYNSETIQLEVQNLLGQTVYSETLKTNIGKQTKMLDISSLNNGVYFILLKNKTNTSTAKFVKQ